MRQAQSGPAPRAPSFKPAVAGMSRGLRGLRYDRLVSGAVLLLIEGLAVESARRSGHAGQDGQSEKSGEKGLHDRSPRFYRSVCCESLLLACAIWCLLHLREDAI